MEYYIERLGKLKETSATFDGENGKDWYIYIQDDTKGGTGGYYILFASPDTAFSSLPERSQYKFDLWVPNKEELEVNLEDHEIEWTEEL